MKQWIARHKIWSSIIGLTVVFVALCVVGVEILSAQIASSSKPVADSCTLSAQSFMTTVNQWRTVADVPALNYSTQLETVAKDHIADMVKYSYYGHTNPVTKAVWYDLIYSKYDTVATKTAEVLDGPRDAQQSLVDFKNSPEHYNALISADYSYLGVVAVYQPQSWAEYDNDGNIQAKAGAYHGNCLVLGELADKNGDSSQVKGASTSVSSTAPAQSTSQQSSINPCVTSYTPYKTTYVYRDYLQQGQTEVLISGINGSTTVCPSRGGYKGYSFATAPTNSTIAIGTGIDAAEQQAAAEAQQQVSAAQQQLDAENAQAAAINSCIRSAESQGANEQEAQSYCSQI